MRYTFKDKRILIIDRQKYWRDLVANTLSQAHSRVAILKDYRYRPKATYFDDKEAPDLVILGCVRIGPEERELINGILAEGLHLMIFSTLLPWEEMRLLFHEGADDVADKTFDQETLISAIDGVLNARQGDSYQRAEEKGLV